MAEIEEKEEALKVIKDTKERQEQSNLLKKKAKS